MKTIKKEVKKEEKSLKKMHVSNLLRLTGDKLFRALDDILKRRIILVK